MMNHENKRPVTLEDLLRLKRAERPPAEFWSQFDQELRAKQLSALVEKRPWWRRLPRFAAGFSRYQLPLGATAALALTIVLVREYRPVSSPVSAAVKSVAVTAAAPVLNESPAVASAPSPISREEVRIASAVETEPATEISNSVVSAKASTPSHVTQLVAMNGVTEDAVSTKSETTPSERFIADNLAIAQSTEPGLAQNFLGSSRGFETRAMPAHPPAVDPLAQMTSPADARRSRLLGGSVMAVSMNTVLPARSGDVRPRHLSDEQLYDSVSRLDLHGNAVGMKF